MLLKHGGVHKRLGVIIQKAGGYDINYIINKLITEYHIPEESLKEVVSKALIGNLDMYLDLLKNGRSIEKVMEFIEYDNDITIAKIDMNPILSNSMEDKYFKGFKGFGKGKIADIRNYGGIL